ncbi:hypothetical protein OU798_23765 [Prolixibacteraceae bacterium Z1-6]|uniref:Cytochrome c domain-containing protein n=1 Tax=Draconibacterium aestuarii TaxID=2998507 RepID=A0A9X3J757_9BACT|nr:hypothetical protein [Prolixibacteraceae bacterium Z1-6]
MKKLKILFSVVFVTFLFTGCLYNFMIPEPEIPTDPDDPDAPEISFTQDIVPIFTSAKCVSCHNGGQAPNLTGTNVYSNIVPGYVNTSDPESSSIYDYPSPATGKHSWAKYSTTQASQILLWINQGAQNN